MNIAIVTETYPPAANGVVRTLQSMGAHCLALGREVTLVRTARVPPDLPHRSRGSMRHLEPRRAAHRLNEPFRDGGYAVRGNPA